MNQAHSRRLFAGMFVFVLAACLAVERDPWKAAVGALIAFGIAGEIAAERARGPGSFAVEILDAIHALDAATLIAKARVS